MLVWAAAAAEHRAGRTGRCLGGQSCCSEEGAVVVGLTAIVIALEEAIAGSEGEAFAAFGYQRVGHRQVAARSCSAATTAIRVRQPSLARRQRCHQCCLGHCSAAGEHR